MKKLGLLLIVVLSLTSCDKEKSVRKKMSGNWTISSIEASYYTNGLVDSTKVIENNGTWNMVDNETRDYNDFIYTHTKVNPRSITSVATAAGRSADSDEMTWYPDDEDSERMVVWQLAPDGYTEPRVVFTVLESKQSSLVIQYVESDDLVNSRYLKYKEVITLTK